MEKRMPETAEEVLDRYITGYHEYVLDTPAHLTYASRNLCDMLDYSQQELIAETADLYMPLVHPADCEKYQCFLNALALEEGTRSLDYRIVKRNGEILYVADIMTSRRLLDGRMAGFSTLTDITALKEENESIRFINDTVPCGLLRYTCEKTPKVTYVNDIMIGLMRIPETTEEELDQKELYKSNIYLMIAPESRSRFAQALQSVYLKGMPYAGELNVVRGDGTKGRLFGWITRCKNREGKDEFQSICMDVTERYERKKSEQTGRYLRALTTIYDLIFEFDRENRTVRYLHGSLPNLGEYLEGIPMQLDQATEKWLNRSVAKSDQGRLRRFLFTHILKEKTNRNGPPQICFRIRREDGSDTEYQAILLQAGASLSYFCCRELTSGTEASMLRRENDSLISRNEEMQEIVRRFTDGVVAFEIVGDRVKPLYVSDNAYAFFGLSEKAWADIAKGSQSIREFVAGTGIDYARYEELFRTGEAEFTYMDVASGTMRRIKAVCSSLENDPEEIKYVMLYQADGGHRDSTPEKGRLRVRIRTFGYFDVFVDERPVMFKTEKAKELLAILVDRQGGYVTPDEAIGILWEDEPASAVVLARYRKVALRLKNILEEYGIPEIVESVNGKRRLVKELVDCDLYRYLSGQEDSASLFHGSYLTNYSWGEMTLGELIDREPKRF